MEANVEEVLTPIQKFYAGTNILITGGTGFLGKLLIEKLLRSCPDIASMYILVRPKKGKDMHQRVDEIFDDVIFDRLKEEDSKFRHKIVAVGGDCSLPELGLSMQDRQMIISQVSVVFHVAATVRFDEKLKYAVAINVRGPQEVVHLCKQLPKLKSAIYVSTAYSQCPNKYIEERFYPPPMDCKKLAVLTDVIPDKLLDNITPVILDKWPNTYTFTKAVSEDVIRNEADGLPFGVFRPAIIISTYKEPIKGWVNNLYGPTGVCAGAGTGILRAIHCDPNVNANIVPVDMCVNALITTGWDVGTRYEKSLEAEKKFEISIYHYESSCDNPTTWGVFMDKAEHYGINSPTIKAIWYYYITLQKNYLFYVLCTIFLHYLPAVLVDGALLCVGKSPRLCKVYQKIHRFSQVIAYFATRNWDFQSNRIRTICDSMSKADREIFFCDLREIDWDEFFKEYIKGIRVYLMQDPLNTLEAARTKWNRLYWLHQACKALFAFLFLRLLWSAFLLI